MNRLFARNRCISSFPSPRLFAPKIIEFVDFETDLNPRGRKGFSLRGEEGFESGTHTRFFKSVIFGGINVKDCSL